ncbi:MAG: hypothetical protein JXA91_00600 [Candidatus Thermoplasmatota archaeon]|nr:hypothetical protein [Candidatus Thermoplasmatota archaeon]
MDTLDPDPLAELPPEFRERFLSARRENIEELAKRGIMTDSPEDRKIITEAFEDMGLVLPSPMGKIVEACQAFLP